MEGRDIAEMLLRGVGLTFAPQVFAPKRFVSRWRSLCSTNWSLPCMLTLRRLPTGWLPDIHAWHHRLVITSICPPPSHPSSISLWNSVPLFFIHLRRCLRIHPFVCASYPPSSTVRVLSLIWAPQSKTSSSIGPKWTFPGLLWLKSVVYGPSLAGDMLWWYIVQSNGCNILQEVSSILSGSPSWTMLWMIFVQFSCFF